MTGSPHRIGSGLKRPLRTLGRMFAALVTLVVVLGSSSIALAGGDDWGGRFAATFDARAVGDPSITSCPALGAGGQKIEARYEGTLTIPAEFIPAEIHAAEFVPAEFSVSLEILFDRTTGAEVAEGAWRLADPPTELTAEGELTAVVQMTDSAELELQGFLIGHVSPPDPDTPALRLLGNFTASLGDGATFPHLNGAVGDPSVGDPSVGDPTSLSSNPAVLIPAVKC